MDIPEVFDKFCDHATSRYDLAAPFVQDGWLYATDCRIAIRTAAKGRDNTIGRVPKGIGGIFKQFKPRGKWNAWPRKNAGIRGTVDCVRCDGAGWLSLTKCEKCNGNAVLLCEHCGCSRDCEQCDGTGEVVKESCNVCDGKGHYCDIARYTVGRTVIAAKYYDLIRSLGKVEWQQRDKDSIYVRHGEYQICLMGMS